MIILLLATRKIISTWIVHPLWGSCSMDLVIDSDCVSRQRLCSVPRFKILVMVIIKVVTIVTVNTIIVIVDIIVITSSTATLSIVKDFAASSWGGHLHGCPHFHQDHQHHHRHRDVHCHRPNYRHIRCDYYHYHHNIDDDHYHYTT